MNVISLICDFVPFLSDQIYIPIATQLSSPQNSWNPTQKLPVASHAG